MARPRGDTRFLWSRDAARVQVLGSGEWVRLFDHEGHGHQVPARPGVVAGVLAGVASEDPECAERLVTELVARGFEWADGLEYEPEVEPSE